MLKRKVVGTRFSDKQATDEIIVQRQVSGSVVVAGLSGLGVLVALIGTVLKCVAGSL